MDTDDRRKLYDRRVSRHRVPPPSVLLMYLVVVIAAVYFIHRSDSRTNDILYDQCQGRQEGRAQTNERNEVFRQDLALTRQVWERIAATQTDPMNKAQAASIADEYKTLITQVKDYDPITCAEIKK